MVSSIAAIPSSAPAAPVDPISAAAGTVASGLEAQAATGTPAPPVATQTPQAQAVSVATAAAAIRQSSLAPLLADLEQAVSLPGVPAPVQAAISQVLAAQTPLDPPPSAAVLQQATAASGLFLEAQLGATATPPAGDLKSALLVVQQVLKTWLDSAPAPAEAPLEQPTQAAAPTTTTTTATSANATSTAIPVDSVQTTGPAAQVTQAAPSPVPILAETPALSAAATTSPPVSAPDAAAVVTPAPASPPTAAVASVPIQTASDTPASNTPAPPVQAAAVTPVPAQPLAPAALPAASQILAAVAVQQLASANSDDAPIPQTSTSLGLLFVADPELSPTAPASALPTAAPPPPPFRDGPTTAQQPVPPSLPAGVEASVAGRRLLTETSGALARQELHQVASLPASSTASPAGARPTETNPRWMFELPFATSQGAAVAQFEISRDGGRGAASGVQPTWRARFSIDLEPMGPVHVQVALTGARAGVSLWAERPATAAQLRAGQASLAEGLEKAEFAPAVSVHVGTPPRNAAPPRAGRFLDQAS